MYSLFWQTQVPLVVEHVPWLSLHFAHSLSQLTPEINLLVPRFRQRHSPTV
jgi:hypothetical protein